MEGIHVFDNSDPAHPEEVTFIEIPGNIDMAIRNQTLFADSYTDLVAIDIADLQNVKEVSRLTAVFPYTIPSYEEGARIGSVDQTKGVVIGWTKKTIHEENTGNIELLPGSSILERAYQRRLRFNHKQWNFRRFSQWRCNVWCGWFFGLFWPVW